jgi:hypothetical protein
LINSYRFNNHVEFNANAPVHFIPLTELSITPASIPVPTITVVPAPIVTVAPTPAPAPADSIGIMAEIGKFIGQAIDAFSYLASSLKKFVMGMSLFKDWFVKS